MQQFQKISAVHLWPNQSCCLSKYEAVLNRWRWCQAVLYRNWQCTETSWPGQKTRACTWTMCGRNTHIQMVSLYISVLKTTENLLVSSLANLMGFAGAQNGKIIAWNVIIWGYMNGEESLPTATVNAPSRHSNSKGGGEGAVSGHSCGWSPLGWGGWGVWLGVVIAGRDCNLGATTSKNLRALTVSGSKIRHLSFIIIALYNQASLSASCMGLGTIFRFWDNLHNLLSGGDFRSDYKWSRFVLYHLLCPTQLKVAFRKHLANSSQHSAHLQTSLVSRRR